MNAVDHVALPHPFGPTIRLCEAIAPRWLSRCLAGSLARVPVLRLATAGLCLALAACGGSADAPPPPQSGPLVATAPTITQQPADLSVTAGQPASFTVAASGTGPLAYQWQRDGVDIAGATAATYAIPATVLGDSGAAFRAVVTNGAGSATSQSATLTVTMSAPVLTIAPQPASASVIGGTMASFTVGGTCSSGTLNIQWQRNGGAGFVDIAGANSGSYGFMTVMADSGAQFRAVLDCSGQSSTPSSAATLTVTAPGGVTLSLLPIVGLREQAEIFALKAIDAQADGTYVLAQNNRIKRLSADLSTIDPVAGDAAPGSADGPAASAQFNGPSGVTHDGAGNLYVADTGNHVIRRIASDGTVSTIAGSPGTSGSTDGTGGGARFDTPWGIALGPDGDLYVADRGNNLVRRVTVAGVVTTYAGSAGSGFVDGAPLAAKFNNPFGIAVAANGDVLVADAFNHRVRRIVRAGAVAGSVETLAGNGSATNADPDGVGTAAEINFPVGIAVRGNTASLVDDRGLLRQIDLTTKAVSTLTGSRTLGPGFSDGTPTTAQLRDPGYGIAPAPAGAFVTVDDKGIRLIDAAGNVTTLASTAASFATPTGVGTLPQEPFVLAVNRFSALAVDAAGRVVVADNGTAELRRIDSGGVVTLAAGLTGGFAGVVDGKGSEAQFVDLGISLASAPGGTLYVGDNNTVRRVAPDNSVATLAGDPTTFGCVDGNAATGRFNRAFGLAVGPTGDVFVGDAGCNAVRRVDALGNVTTYAGVFGQSMRIDGPIAAARFIGPRSLAFAADGSLYVADYLILGSGGAVRKIAADGSSVTTIPEVGGQVLMLTVDTAGTLFYVDPAGLWMLPAGAATATLLIPHTNGNSVLGTTPQLSFVNAIGMLGPKQILLIAGGQILVATLP